ncbi:MAG: VWA domain-containing protein [Deltaproteobacteria bacterium]|nr:VWA domain-containing protein [Deltaproteobacteria bacterium]
MLLAVFWSLAPDLALGEEPILMPGKKTLYQKVITHPGAARYSTPGGQSQGPLVPFSVLYLYGRKMVNGRLWINCAGNTTGEDKFWVPHDLTSEWKQSLVLVLAHRATREPILFFKNKEDLVSIASNPNIANTMDQLAKKFQDYKEAGQDPPENFPVGAMEPPEEEGAVPHDKFYLIPILSHDFTFETVKFLEVASINPAISPEGDDPEEGDSRPSPPEDRVTNAIAFVIDTTISMGPYIEECRELTRRIYDRVMDSGQGANVAIGVVAFRSSVLATPGIEYTTKIISPLLTAMDRDELEDALDEVEEAKVSTHAYAEDSLAGLNTAIEQLDWNPYRGRIIFLLTDAGPLKLDDPFNSTPATPDTIYEKAKVKNIKIVPIHIKAPAGSNNHNEAERAYRAMAFGEDDDSTYSDILAANPTMGAENFDEVASEIILRMEEELFEVPAEKRGAPPEKLTPQKKKAANIGAILGHSIKLDYLGARNKAKVPHMEKSWIYDLDLGKLDQTDPHRVRTVEVAVLLSKNQLSALARQLKIILAKAEENMTSQSMDFFRNILSASAQISRDPGQFSLTPETTLAELGGLGEFLEDLPYKSRIMGLTESQWYNMSPGEQDAFVRAIKARLQAYDEYDKDVDLWAKFDKKNDGEWLYRVPLTMMP